MKVRCSFENRLEMNEKVKRSESQCKNIELKDDFKAIPFYAIWMYECYVKY